MKLIVGLGNIGRKYEKTRHNIGFEVLESLAARSPGASAKEKFDGRASLGNAFKPEVTGRLASVLMPRLTDR